MVGSKGGDGKRRRASREKGVSYGRLEADLGCV